MSWIPFLHKKEKNRVLVKTFDNKSENSKIHLLSFHGDIRDQIIDYLDKQFLTEGKHIEDGGILSSKTMLSLIGGGGLAISSHSSSCLYMATANSKNLMKIGNGFGSAILKNGRIVGHAPFIPVSNVLLPVVTPLMAFQVVSTISILDNFKLINEKLDHIQKSIDRIIKRNEATFIGEVISAVNRIKDIENRLSVSKEFTNDMLVRLAILEDRINSIFERYYYLYENQNIDYEEEISKKISVEDLNFKKMDAYMLLVTSILDIKIDQLRLKLAIQENPAYIKQASKKFIDKIEHYCQLWQCIKEDSVGVRKLHNNIKNAIDHMNWWQKHMPSWLLGKHKEYKELEEEDEQLEPLITDDGLEKFVEKELEQYKNYQKHNNNVALIYLRKEDREYSYYTNDIVINKAA